MNTKKARNRALAAALRDEFGTTSTPVMYDGLDIWGRAKKELEEGFTPEQAARNVRATLPAAMQEDIKKAKVALGAKKAMKAIALDTKKKPLSSKAASSTATKGTSQVVLNEQAERVKAGNVLRDAKGRIMPREYQEAFEAVNS